MPPTVAKTTQGKGRQSRKTAPQAFENENSDASGGAVDEEVDEEDKSANDGDEEEEEDSSAMFLKMFDAIRKNAAKAKAGSRGSARQQELSSKADKYRREVEVFVADGNAYIDELVASANQLRDESKNSTKTKTKEMQNAGQQLWTNMNGSMQAVLELSTSLGSDIATKRVEEINDACRRIALQPNRRAKSLRGLKRTLREEVTEVVEYEQVASDAGALIRNYKAMLRT